MVPSWSATAHPRSTTVRIVDPETRMENPAGKVGEIWVHGDKVAMRLLAQPAAVGAHVRRRAGRPVAGHPAGALAAHRRPRCHVRGRAVHHRPHQGPADRRRTQPLPRRHRGDHSGDHRRPRRGDLDPGRAHASNWWRSPKLKKRGDSEAEALDTLRAVKREVASAISKSHSVRVADLVLVAPGSIPITTSGKIRRSACVDRYRQDEFSRLDTTT